MSLQLKTRASEQALDSFLLQMKQSKELIQSAENQEIIDENKALIANIRFALQLMYNHYFDLRKIQEQFNELCMLPNEKNPLYVEVDSFLMRYSYRLDKFASQYGL
jgi:hypothetical protein